MGERGGLAYVMLKSVLFWIGIVGTFSWGWGHMRDRAPGPVKLLYWILFLLMFHLAAAH